MQNPSTDLVSSRVSFEYSPPCYISTGRIFTCPRTVGDCFFKIKIKMESSRGAKLHPRLFLVSMALYIHILHVLFRTAQFVSYSSPTYCLWCSAGVWVEFCFLEWLRLGPTRRPRPKAPDMYSRIRAAGSWRLSAVDRPRLRRPTHSGRRETRETARPRNGSQQNEKTGFLGK